MKKILLLSLIVLSSKLYSTELDCSIQLNLDIISETRVSSVLGLQKSIDALEGISAYVTEKGNGDYIVEAYLADYELRIYAEGSLRDPKDKLVASLWGRESIVDVECHLATDFKKIK